MHAQVPRALPCRRRKIAELSEKRRKQMATALFSIIESLMQCPPTSIAMHSVVPDVVAGIHPNY
jgi:hypothetical protein